MVSAVRIAINNLAGVPSIVFGVFGLGFFCYIVGGSIDQAVLRGEAAQPDLRQGRCAVGLAHAGAADPAGGDRGHRGGAGGGAALHARGLLRLRRQQVADDPAHRAAAGDARHHDRVHPRHGAGRGRGGAADAGGRGQTGARPAARRRGALPAPRPQLHAPGLSHLRPGVPEPEQRGGQADGVHHHAAAHLHHRIVEHLLPCGCARGCGARFVGGTF